MSEERRLADEDGELKKHLIFFLFALFTLLGCIGESLF
jgi:hypothetical protein